MSPWVVVPEIERCGLIYDLADFSETLSRLRWSGAESQDEAFRAFVRFQRKLGRIANRSGLKLEKYLGDGAFFSSREAARVLLGAVRFQRIYGEARSWGLPFDKGVRMAVGYGPYRFVPIPSDEVGAGDRYEFFGQGLVELSRLTSGKASREIDEVRMHLLNLGYPEATVHASSRPVLAERLEVVDVDEEKRDYYAYLNRNGTLVNEGIVATARLVERLSNELQAHPLSFETIGQRVYVAFELEDSLGGRTHRDTQARCRQSQGTGSNRGVRGGRLRAAPPTGTPPTPAAAVSSCSKRPSPGTSVADRAAESEPLGELSGDDVP